MSITKQNLIFIALLLGTFLLCVGCAAPQADQGTSSGWTDVSEPNVTVNFYAEGSSTDGEAVEGDTVPAGRIVLNNSTITVTVSVGSDGEAQATRGDANADNTPTVEAEIPLIP